MKEHISRNNIKIYNETNFEISVTGYNFKTTVLIVLDVLYSLNK